MIILANEKVPLEKCPALVLNADFRPLSYYPLSLWCWQDAIKSVFLNRVTIVSCYKSLFGSKCVLSKKMKTKKDRDKYDFKFDKDIIKQDKELFEFRKIKVENIYYIF